MRTVPSTRDACSAASSSAQFPPWDRATTTARSVPVASSTANAYATWAAWSYASGASGRSERPLPGPSNVTTRWCRARYGTCIFQNRLWMIVHVGSSRIVGMPLPWIS
jgi:hypothetical protein